MNLMELKFALLITSFFIFFGLFFQEMNEPRTCGNLGYIRSIPKNGNGVTR